jgi:hypothetical protein
MLQRQSMKVKLRAAGGGLTVGKSAIKDGKGEFTSISGGIKELLGSYVAAEAHAGAVKSAQANVMTKGEVSLSLAGTGEGWDLGIASGSSRSILRRGASCHHRAIRGARYLHHE